MAKRGVSAELGNVKGRKIRCLARRVGFEIKGLRAELVISAVEEG
jgi:hypothetical protein